MPVNEAARNSFVKIFDMLGGFVHFLTDLESQKPRIVATLGISLWPKHANG
jgi:hypothetical protein